MIHTMSKNKTYQSIYKTGPKDSQNYTVQKLRKQTKLYPQT